MKIIAILICTFSITACSWPKLYGNDSCGTGKTAYVTANGQAAICLPEREVAYILCARELGLSTVTESNSYEGGITLNVGGADQGAIGVITKELTQLFAAEGALASARANAINACLSIYKGEK